MAAWRTFSLQDLSLPKSLVLNDISYVNKMFVYIISTIAIFTDRINPSFLNCLLPL